MDKFEESKRTPETNPWNENSAKLNGLLVTEIIRELQDWYKNYNRIQWRKKWWEIRKQDEVLKTTKWKNIT
jgi:hypothetical protein